MLSGWGADLTATNRGICKLRAFIVNISKSETVLYILFAMIDRWLSSSPKAEYRQMSSLKNAYRAMLISLIVSAIVFSHVIYCQEPNRINAPQKCYGITIACQFATDLLFMAFVIFPLPCMLVFGVMTIYNIRQSRSRVAPKDSSMITNAVKINRNQQRRLAKQDHNLLVMLLVQTLVLFVLSIPLCFQRLFATIMADKPASVLQVAINNLVFNIGQLLHFIANGMPFYIYTLTGGSTFRNALLKLLVNRRH
ncbi:unnamed protein product [Rotaria sp. Silwood2]|nr:unnamed protein product [Rotaria sp. Silwood2]